jgi:hypothetical protein
MKKITLGCHAIYLSAVAVRGLLIVGGLRRRVGFGSAAHGIDECIDDHDRCRRFRNADLEFRVRHILHRLGWMERNTRHQRHAEHGCADRRCELFTGVRRLRRDQSDLDSRDHRQCAANCAIERNAHRSRVRKRLHAYVEFISCHIVRGQRRLERRARRQRHGEHRHAGSKRNLFFDLHGARRNHRACDGCCHRISRSYGCAHRDSNCRRFGRQFESRVEVE